MTENGNGKKDQKLAPAPGFVRYTNQVAKTVLRGIKMASPEIYNPLVSPLFVADTLKQLGAQALALKPETLFLLIDQKFGGWDGVRSAKAMESFHETGVIDTDVPDLVRQKVYAVRILMTSDSAHHEWHIFEKIGGAFNNRLGHFGVIEPLTPIECARAIAIMDAIRPDTFSNEIKAYVAAASHEAGFYTLLPSKYLKMSESHLANMNREETGRTTDDKIVSAVDEKLRAFKAAGSNLESVPEDFVSVQALKLLALDAAGDEAARI